MKNGERSPVTFLLALILLCLIGAGLTDGELQQGLVILDLLLFNYYLYKQLNIRRELVLWSGIGLTVIFMGLTYLQYGNALDLGFEDGLLYGMLNEQHEYYDTSEYYYESCDLAHLLESTSGRELWLSGDAIFSGTYGPYNAYNVINALLILLFGDNLMTLVLLKLHFSVLSIYLLYLISTRFTEKLALYPVFLYHLYPGYLLPTTVLLRDNIIAALIIGLGYVFSKAAAGKIVLNVKNSLHIGLLCIALLYFRNYAFVIMAGCAMVYYCVKHEKIRKRMVVTVCLLGIMVSLLFRLNMSVEDFELFQEDGPHIWEQDTPGIARMLLRVLYFLFLGQPAIADHFYFGAVSEWLNFLAYIYLHIILLFSLVALVAIVKEKCGHRDRETLLIFGYLMPAAFLLLLTYIFGWPIPRLYNMWLWVSVIIMVVYFESVDSFGRILSTCSIIALTAAFYFVKFSPVSGVLRIGNFFQ